MDEWMDGWTDKDDSVLCCFMRGAHPCRT